MEKTTHDAPEHQAARVEAKPSPPEKKGGAITGSIKWLLATKTWTKQASILKKRGSFPLLRQVLKNNIVSNRVIIPTEIINDHLLAKSILGHRMIVVFAMIPLLYGLVMLPRGLAIGLKLGQWLNAPLVLSIPILLYSGMRILMSLKVLKALTAEFASRNRADADASPAGAPDV